MRRATAFLITLFRQFCNLLERLPESAILGSDVGRAVFLDRLEAEQLVGGDIESLREGNEGLRRRIAATGLVVGDCALGGCDGSGEFNMGHASGLTESNQANPEIGGGLLLLGHRAGESKAQIQIGVVWLERINIIRINVGRVNARRPTDEMSPFHS